MKKCPKCESEMFISMEPRVATLANADNKMPKQIKYLRCSNSGCSYIEKP